MPGMGQYPAGSQPRLNQGLDGNPGLSSGLGYPVND